MLMFFTVFGLLLGALGRFGFSSSGWHFHPGVSECWCNLTVMVAVVIKVII